MALPAFKSTLEELQKLKSVFGRDSEQRKKLLLESLANYQVSGKANITQYHELLLFIRAYPDSPVILKLVNNELLRIASTLANLAKTDPESFYHNFDQSGIAYSKVSLAPSLEAFSWMLETFSSDMELQVDADFTKKIGELVPLLCSDAEQDGLIDDRFDAIDWLDLASGDKTGKHNRMLRWLVNKLAKLQVTSRISDYLVEKAGISVNITLNKPDQSRTLHLLKETPCFWQQDELQRNINVAEQISKKCYDVRELYGKEKNSIISSAKMVLAARGRETDPVTYAEKVIEVCVERGLKIFLFSMSYDRKLPIENYTGFVAYRNGVPVGYGGGWIFLERCEIGVNIFETFRGGENSLIFTNILRVYNHAFGIRKFVVPPYQFGEDNEEGLKSGAFWFYYKLGFRPADKYLEELADDEFEKIKNGKGYKTPVRILKKLTWAPLVLIHGQINTEFEPKHLSIALTKWISSEFNGDGNKASKFSLNYITKHLGKKALARLNKAEKYSVKAWAPLIAMCNAAGDMNHDEKKMLLDILKSKGDDEITFSVLLKKHRKLIKAFNQAAFR